MSPDERLERGVVDDRQIGYGGQHRPGCIGDVAVRSDRSGELRQILGNGHSSLFGAKSAVRRTYGSSAGTTTYFARGDGTPPRFPATGSRRVGGRRPG